MGFNYKLKYQDFLFTFFARILRMFSYGILSVILYQTLFYKGLTAQKIGWIQSALIFGELIITFILTTQANRIGRKNTLMIASFLQIITGLIYAQAQKAIYLIVSGMIGVITITGGEVGPFMAIQQSILARLAQQCSQTKQEIGRNTSKVLKYYNIAGYISQGTGAIFAGLWISIGMDSYLISLQDSTQTLVILFAIIGGVNMLIYYSMNRESIEPQQIIQRQMTICNNIQSDNINKIIVMSLLFMIDAFADAFIVQTIISFYFSAKYHIFFDKIGFIIFTSTILYGISDSLSHKISNKIGVVATIIYTHLPSNLLLILIYFVQNSSISVFLLFIHCLTSQMDLPARQIYFSSIISKDQKSEVNRIINFTRAIGLIFGLLLNGYFMSETTDSNVFSYGFLIAGSVKIVYDIVISFLFLSSKKGQRDAKTTLGSTELVETSYGS